MEFGKYDPLAIDAIDLKIKKNAKYSLVKTIIISLIIVALVIFINLTHIQNLFVERRDLEITSSLSKSEAQPFTYSPICLTVPLGESLTTILQHKNKDGEITNLPKMETIDDQIKELVENKTYQCYNIQGYTLNKNERFLIYFNNSGPMVDYHVQTNMIKDALDQNRPTFANLTIAQQSRKEWYWRVSKIIYDDSWSVSSTNYTYRFQGSEISNQLGFTASMNTGEIFFFNYGQIQQNLNVYVYTITREKIYEVLGRILAWKGILVMIFVFLINPLIESSLRYEITKSRYKSQQIEKFQHSFPVQIKRNISPYLCHAFEQQKLTKYIDKVEKDLDLVVILKKLKIMNSIVKQLEFQDRSIQISKCYEVENTLEILDEIDEDGIQAKVQDQNMKEDPENQQISLQQEEEPKQLCGKAKSFVQSIFTFFDSAPYDFNIVPNKGRGHGSLCNIIFLTLVAAGLLTFLVLAGILQIQTEQKKIDILPTQKSQGTLIIKKNGLAVQYWNLMFTLNPIFQVINGTTKQTIEQIPVDYGYACYQRLASTPDQVSVDFSQSGYWVCPSKDITLERYKSELSYLKITWAISDPTANWAAMMTKTDYYVAEDVIKEGKIQPKTIYFRFFHFAGQIPLYKIGNLVDGWQQDMVIRYVNQATSFYRQTQLQAILYPSKVFTYSQMQTSSIWDILDNSWGIVMLCFEIFIFRISFLINNKMKAYKSIEQEDSSRNNIVLIFRDIDRIVSGLFKEQLCSVPCYQKTQLQTQSLQV